MRISAFLPALVLACALVGLGAFVRGATGPAVVGIALVAAVAAALLPRMGERTAGGATLLTSAVLALTAGAALAAVLLSPDDEPLLWWALVPALAVPVLFVLQLLRGTGTSGRVDAMARGAAAALAVASAAGWIVWGRQAVPDAGPEVGAIVTAAVGVVLAGLLAGAMAKWAGTGWGADADHATTGPVLVSIGAAVTAVCAVGAPVALVTQAVLELG